MKNSDLIISQIRQRLEILYQMVDELEESGGGGVTSYDMLTEKPKINGYTLSGNVSLDDIGAVSKDELATKQDTLTVAQLSAVNSGIDSSKVAQIATNTNSISEQEIALDEDRAALVELVDGGAKSILPNSAVNQTINNVDFTVNADKSVTANGTASIAAYLILADNATLKAGTYVISGGAPDVRVVLATAATASAIIAQSQGSATIFTLNEDTSGLLYAVRMSTGALADNITVYPMICTKAAWDISQQYVPYRPSYDELIARIEALEGGV